MPLFYPTVYSVEYRRVPALAASTIWNDEEALKHLLVWASNADIECSLLQLVIEANAISFLIRL